MRRFEKSDFNPQPVTRNPQKKLLIRRREADRSFRQLKESQVPEVELYLRSASG
jgi:hypothetical protein